MIENFEGGGKIIRMMTDANQSTFRYGLHQYADSQFEDPTYLGFTLEIDQESALFTQVLPFLEKHAATRKELEARIPIYKEFVNKITMMFNSQESVTDEAERTKFIKQHYINSITGLDNLTKKFNVWKEDKLTFELYEDISLFTSYIAYLYNNLVYSYENGRELIPENLLKFNLYVKISEIRNLTNLRMIASNDPTENNIANALKNNVTSIIYKLYDCQFDFMSSKPFDDNIAINGIDGQAPPDAILNMDLYFKSVSRQIYNPLINNSISMNDNMVDLDVLIVDTSGNASPSGQDINGNTNLSGPDGEPYQQFNVESDSVYNKQAFLNDGRAASSENSETQKEKIKNEGLIERNEVIEQMKIHNSKYDVDEELLNRNTDGSYDPNASLENRFNDDNLGFDKRLSNFTNDVKKNTQNSVEEAKRKILDLAERKKQELKRGLVLGVKKSIGISKIHPENVNDENKFVDTVQTMKNKLGNVIFDDLVKNITE